VRRQSRWWTDQARDDLLGLVTVEAKQIIDATGDGDVAAWSGSEVDKNDPLMPMTMHFRVGHVHARKGLGSEAREHLLRAQDRGELPMFYGPAIMFAFAKDEAYFHAIRVVGDGTDAADLTSRPFDDAVATGCWYLDVHPNTTTLGSANDTERVQPSPYDIPYRALLSKDVSNLAVAGRCHSATALAASSTRVNVTAMAMGEAAGTTAALAVEAKDELGQLDGTKVRERLEFLNAGPTR